MPVIYEQIEGDYYYAFNDGTFIIRKSDGYINASKLCQASDKSFNDWETKYENIQLVKSIAG